MRILTIYSSIICLISTMPMAFTILFVVPRVREELTVWGARLKYGWLHAPLKWNEGVLLLAFIGVLVGILFLSFACSNKLWKKHNEKVIKNGLVPFSIMLFLLSSWHGMSVWAGSSSLNQEMVSRMKAYQYALEKFLLLEQTEGRIKEAKEIFDSISTHEAVEIDDVADFERYEESKHWNRLLSLIRKEAGHVDPDDKKLSRLLSTASLFRRRLMEPRSASGWIHKPFTKLTGLRMKNTDQVFDWIGQQDDAKWKPFKIYRVVELSSL